MSDFEQQQQPADQRQMLVRTHVCGWITLVSVKLWRQGLIHISVMLMQRLKPSSSQPHSPARKVLQSSSELLHRVSSKQSMACARSCYHLHAYSPAYPCSAGLHIKCLAKPVSCSCMSTPQAHLIEASTEQLHKMVQDSPDHRLHGFKMLGLMIWPLLHGNILQTRYVNRTPRSLVLQGAQVETQFQSRFHSASAELKSKELTYARPAKPATDGGKAKENLEKRQ